MLSESQIKQILLSLKETDNGFQFHSVDRAIYTNIDDVAPYVIEFVRDIRGFRCQGLSEFGKSLVD